MKGYLIMTDKHDSNYGQKFVLFWGHNRSGYTSDVSVAGRYTEDEAKLIHNPNEGHYMINEGLLGVPFIGESNFLLLIEKGRVNNILLENKEKQVFRRNRSGY